MRTTAPEISVCAARKFRAVPQGHRVLETTKRTAATSRQRAAAKTSNARIRVEMAAAVGFVKSRRTRRIS